WPVRARCLAQKIAVALRILVDRAKAGRALSRIAQLDQRTASRTNVCTRRKRTCGPQGGSPGLTDAVEKCPAIVGFAIEEGFCGYSWPGVAALGWRTPRPDCHAPLTQSTRTLRLLAGRVAAAPWSEGFAQWLQGGTRRGRR